MSSLGFVMLCHTALNRAAQVARYWAERDCPVVVHVDARARAAEVEAMRAELSDLWNVRFCRRYACEWGRWSLVAATQAASEMLLREFASVRHVYLASGSCLPLRPVEELRDWLDARPRTDFIESVTTEEVDWTTGGLAEERFHLRFPFSWKRHRWLFDKSVEWQRRLGLSRAVPDGVSPHLGSQWWCLTRQTLSAILQDPRRAEFDRYFRDVWIPDESYFQTLARRYGAQIESRTLTLSKFDFQGKPHVFYDDHLDLLRRSDCFVARKAWPGADALYDAFLSAPPGAPRVAEPQPDRIDRVFARATERRTRGRAGLYMAGRFPNPDWENGKSAAPYTVCHGLDAVFEEFPDWLSRQTGNRVHGHLFDPERADFADEAEVFAGAVSDSAALRDYNPDRFLTNLVWNTRGERLVFQFGPADRQEVTEFAVTDPNAAFWVVTGAWAIPLHRQNRDFAELRRRAALLQKVEAQFLERLHSVQTRAVTHIWSLGEFLDQPMEHLQTLIDHIAGPAAPRLAEAPRMAEIEGLRGFVQALKNQGMNPVLVGELPNPDPAPRPPARTRPYLVR
ncbi:glycosyl transferase [Rhodobacterales bacterium HKCCE2091]|nr:glycosyl transferase [Rhodobacterales bacterium HKCCE2091]